jgi:Ca-activated chloride channel homolog
MQSAILVLCTLVFAQAGAVPPAPSNGHEPALTVRITSPLGRTGLTGPVRIVAQVRASSAAPLQVRFFVDNELLHTVEQAPWAVEWNDDNPFDRREIAVEVVDATGNTASDAVVLEPLEVNETAQVTSVLVEASVMDPNGRSVRHLGPSGFRLYEDGALQLLELARQEEVGATFALLVDASGSMSRRMDFVQRTAATLSGYMRPLDRMIVAPFRNTLDALTGPTDDRPTIVEAIEAIRPSGGTAILDSLIGVARTLENAEGRRAIVLITDGYDEHSKATFEEALQAVKAAHATVYVVGIGGVAGISLRGERLLRQIAEETGGRFFFPSRDEQLVAVHDRLTDDVQNRYLLSYTPSNQAIDGSWREILVETADPDLVVRARGGYFAPTPPPIRPTIEFTAFDAGGHYIDVTTDDLEVLEDGVPQEVEVFHEAVLPVSIVLALDASGSMRRSVEPLMAAAREFVDALRPEDQLATVLFADRVVFAHDLSRNRDFAYEAIAGYQAVGGTALYDAIGDSLLRLRRVPGRRVVVVMTDGRDEDNPGTGPGSRRRLPDVLGQLQESGVTVFTIGLGTQIDREPLEQFAELSGGLALFPAEIDELGSQFRRVVEDLRRRYVLGFTSTHVQHDGRWRQVEIRLRSAPDATVRSLGGYFAPSR